MSNSNLLLFALFILSLNLLGVAGNCEADADCQNGGTCADTTCQCTEGFSGATCEENSKQKLLIIGGAAFVVIAIIVIIFIIHGGRNNEENDDISNSFQFSESSAADSVNLEDDASDNSGNRAKTKFHSAFESPKKAKKEKDSRFNNIRKDVDDDGYHFQSQFLASGKNESETDNDDANSKASSQSTVSLSTNKNYAEFRKTTLSIPEDAGYETRRKTRISMKVTQSKSRAASVVDSHLQDRRKSRLTVVKTDLEQRFDSITKRMSIITDRKTMLREKSGEKPAKFKLPKFIGFITPEEFQAIPDPIFDELDFIFKKFSEGSFYMLAGQFRDLFKHFHVEQDTDDLRKIIERVNIGEPADSRSAHPPFTLTFLGFLSILEHAKLDESANNGPIEAVLDFVKSVEIVHGLRNHVSPCDAE